MIIQYVLLQKFQIFFYNLFLCYFLVFRTLSPHFPRFPSNRDLRAKWVRNISCTKKINKYSVICSKHFKPEDYVDHLSRPVIKETAIPTVFLQLPNDMDNYMEYHLMGSVSQIRMKPGCLPTKFQCQPDRRKRTSDATKRSYILKKQRKSLIEECQKDLEEISTKQENKIKAIHDNSEKLDKVKDNHADMPAIKSSSIAREFEQNKSELVNMILRKENEGRLHRIKSTELEEKSQIQCLSSDKIDDKLMKEDTMSETLPDINSVKEEKDEECRACLQKIDSEYIFYNIFDCWPQQMGEMENIIAEDLSKLANVQLLQTDEHSKVICEACCTLLQSACNFVATVRRSDEILRHRYKNNESVDRIWPKPIQLNKNIDSAMYDNGVNVEIKQEANSEDEYNGYDDSVVREENFENMDIKVEPEEITQQMPPQAIVNGITNDWTNDNPELTNGNDNSSEEAKPCVKDEPESAEDDSDVVLPDMSLECMLCMKAFSSVTGLKAHVIAQHSYKSVKRKVSNNNSPQKKKRKYTCTTCRRNFTTSTDLMVHETCHNKSVCYGCNGNFDSFAELTEHRTTCSASARREVTKLRTLDDVKSETNIDRTHAQRQNEHQSSKGIEKQHQSPKLLAKTNAQRQQRFRQNQKKKRQSEPLKSSLARPPSQETETEFKCSICNITFSELYYMRVHQEAHHNADDEQNDTGSEDAMEVEALDVFE